MDNDLRQELQQQQEQQEQQEQQGEKLPKFKKFNKSKNLRKRNAATEGDANETNEGSSRASNPKEEDVVIKKKQRTTASSSAITASSGYSKPQEDLLKHTFSSTGTAESLRPRDMGATRTYNPDVPISSSSKEVLKEGAILNAEDLEPETITPTGEQVYKGMNAYKSYNPTQSTNIKVGPIQNTTSNVRITCRFDYQPDICKDYKETGYCGYGDSCKFMHDRSDYKSGWQLEKEWEEEQKKKKQEKELKEFLEQDDADGDELGTGTGVGEKEKDKEELPFACFICRKEFVNPIVTKCNHYFCESCAINHHRKSPKCYVCGVNTNGVFNVAKNIVERMKKKKDGQ